MRDYYYDYHKDYVKPRRRRGFFIVVLILALFVLYYKGLPYIRDGVQDWVGVHFTASESASSEADSSVSSFDEIENSAIPQDTIEALETLAKTDSKAMTIVQNPGQYPERLLESLGRNSELLDFTLDYPSKKGTFSSNIDLSSQYQAGRVPLLMQWDEKWGYASYGDGIIALDGCGPTCLSMVLIGLTGDTSENPKAVANFSDQNGYVDEQSNSTLWTLMSAGAKQLGLNSSEIPLNEERMERELSEGHPIICCMGPGDFTTQGHFIVVYQYQNGAFLIHDPNSKERSEETWSYEKLEPQIRNLWAFSS